jgi:biotin transporter BioY
MEPSTRTLPATLQSATNSRGMILPVAIGTLFLAASSWIAVPSVPIPINMQTYAVIVIGALMGTRMGVITVMAWLAEAALGLPVLSGASGLAVFAGPSAGYLVSFPVIAAITGWLADRRLDGTVLRSLAGMLTANVINLALGVFWLATFLGVADRLAPRGRRRLHALLDRRPDQGGHGDGHHPRRPQAACQALPHGSLMAIALRPHHLLCMLTFVGKGYNPAFVANLEQVVRRIARGTEAIEIVAGPDAICAPLLGDSDCHCHRGSVTLRDRHATAALETLLQRPLAPGDQLFLTRADLDRLRAAFAAGSIRQACEGCQWQPLCDGIAEREFAETLLLHPA